MLQLCGSVAPAPDPVFRMASRVHAPLGVGMLLTPSRRHLVERHLDQLDFVSVVPESFWPDSDPVSIERSTSIHAAIRVLDRVAAERPLVAHGRGLMIGATAPLDRRHLSRIAEWHARYGFRWYGEQLAFAPVPLVDHASPGDVSVPRHRQALKEVVDRVREVQAFLPVPFLVENSLWPAGVPALDMSEPMFLNRLCAAAGCGLVLDVNTLYANAVNCGIDALSFLDRLDLARVVEVHVSSEPPMSAVHGYCPAALRPPTVLEVLEAMMWRAPRLRAVTIESPETGSAGSNEDRFERAIDGARRIWKLYH